VRSQLIVVAVFIAASPPYSQVALPYSHVAQPFRAAGQASVDVVTLGVANTANATPSIAADGDTVAVAWGARGESGTDVFVAVSKDAGRTFAAPARVNNATGTARLGGEMPPRVAVSGRRVDVLWTARSPETTILLARSLDDGRTFAAARALQRADAPGDRGWPALAADTRGNVHAAWLDHRGAAGTHHYVQLPTSNAQLPKRLRSSAVLAECTRRQP